jgi:hypothetical protein
MDFCRKRKLKSMKPKDVPALVLFLVGVKKAITTFLHFSWEGVNVSISSTSKVSLSLLFYFLSIQDLHSLRVLRYLLTIKYCKVSIFQEYI